MTVCGHGLIDGRASIRSTDLIRDVEVSNEPCLHHLNPYPTTNHSIVCFSIHTTQQCPSPRQRQGDRRRRNAMLSPPAGQANHPIHSPLYLIQCTAAGLHLCTLLCPMHQPTRTDSSRHRRRNNRAPLTRGRHRLWLWHWIWQAEESQSYRAKKVQVRLDEKPSQMSLDCSTFMPWLFHISSVSHTF
jgi:hypothetical protein